MSDLQKSMARPHTKPLPRPVPPITEDDGGEPSDSSSASSMSSTGTIVPQDTSQRHSSSVAAWQPYFEQELYLECPSRQAKYHVYLTEPTNPSKDPLFVCHHGAGSSGLSFALFSREVRKRLPGAGVLSVEARDHGSVVGTSPPDARHHATDFSLDALAQDLLEMIHLTQARLWEELPNLVLVGHSLGGAVVTSVAKSAALGSKLMGFAVIDVVEGSAIDALKSMQSYLAGRPSTFRSVEAAIDWHVRSRTIRNPSSAAISTPALLIEIRPGLWTWRTDLASTQSFWQDWFKGLSAGFLSGKAAKLLLLAGTDRLDKELMIGQMQGKFQMQVFPEAGHFVHEDLPERTAEVVIEFYKRNDRSTLVLPPKVSDLLAQGKKV